MRTHGFCLAAVLAASAVVAAPANAQRMVSPTAPAVSAEGAHGLQARGPNHRDGWRDRGGRHHRWRNGWGNSFVYYGGEWARWNNRSFEPESYNDWWHERPNRSLPRWTRNNGDCRQQYWTSAGWTC